MKEDSLLSITGFSVPISSIEEAPEKEQNQTVYNLHLTTPNTYFVKLNNDWVLVHNLKNVTPF